MTKQETYAFLRAHGVEFEITEHAAVYNMAECAELELPYPEADAKNLFVRDDKKRNYYLITVRGDKRVDLKEFRKAHGTRPLSFASPEELQDFFEADARLCHAAGTSERRDAQRPVLSGRGLSSAAGAHRRPPERQYCDSLDAG